MFLFSKKKKPSEDSIKRFDNQLCLVSCIFSFFFFLFVYNILLSQCTASNLNTPACFVQAKEAGADDILDISACELAEVNYRLSALQY